VGFYENRILPRLLDFAMRQEQLTAYRRRLVPEARGRVLEIGVGSGRNLPFYGSLATEVIGLDPSARLLEMARAALPESSAPPIELIEASAESIPFDDRSFDTVVVTWTLCSIADVESALRETRRVLAPSGRLLFVEHGRSPDRSVTRWQDRLTPTWKRLAGGCHLNRPVQALLEGSGFRLEELATGYAQGPRPMTFMYEGIATPR
jgi:ubiquinone/menaquinone biosynthesis C-methylase UbiE